MLWLTHPTELGDLPDKIQLMEVVTVDFDKHYGPLIYYVFRYRMLPSHSAGKYGWMAGVSGPYLRDSSEPLASAPGTFSEFRPFAAATPMEHAESVHLEIVRAGILRNWLQKLGRQKD